jgi:hypothetical protein
MTFLLGLSSRALRGLACAAVALAAMCSSQASAGTIYGIDDADRIFTFDSAAPQDILSGAPLSGLKTNEHLINIDFRPSNNTLYGIGSSYQLYSIVPGTGVCTPVGAGFGFVPGNSFGMDFNPVADRIRFFSDTEDSIRVDPNTGLLAATDTSLAYKAGDPKFGVNPNVVGAGYTNSVSPTPSATTLYGIDSNTNTLVRIGGVNGGAPEGSPNAGLLTTIGALGVNANNLLGFDISANNVAFASLSTGGDSSLYNIDLNTGAALNLGQIIGGVRVVDIALQPNVSFNAPEPTSMALAALGIATLFAFRKTKRSAAGA